MTAENTAYHARWHPASGHPGGWRVVREFFDGRPMEEARGPKGHLRLFKSLSAANQAANALEGKLPKRVQRIVDTVKAGQTLCKSLRQKRDGETEVKFYFEPSGHAVETVSAQRAVASGLLHEVGDGLLPELSQTWRGAA